ncbi:MAG TPA: ATP-binding protein [Roseiflexaceae bacterium]|nr:ATP-binding protein [Roseiflexaceae bacterium]
MALSLRWRLTGWYVLLLAGVLLLFSLTTYLAVQRLLTENFDAVLRQQAALVAQAIDEDDGQPSLAQDVWLPDIRDSQHFTRIYRTDRRRSFNSSTVPEPIPELLDAVEVALRGQQHLAQVRLERTTLRVVTLPIVHERQIVGALQVGVALTGIEETMAALLRVLLVLAPATLLAASGGGWFLANRALTPIDQITRTARRISAENLSGRIGLQGPDDEIGRLARTFDSMLARLEAAFVRQQQFTADASHELRTPLTAVIGQIDVALEWPGTLESYRRTLRAVREQVERLTRLTNDLLLLARADGQFLSEPVEPVDLGSILPALVAQVEPLARTRDVALALPPVPSITVPGNEDHLIRLFMNLLDNAIRYTPAGGQVTLGVMCQPGRVGVRVADSGPGIAPEHLPHLFDRFYRVDAGRSRGQGGSGLGLAIAQRIAQAHGGAITVESAVGVGSTFTVWLPTEARGVGRERVAVG